jgi:hypothetical protein
MIGNCPTDCSRDYTYHMQFLDPPIASPVTIITRRELYTCRTHCRVSPRRRTREVTTSATLRRRTPDGRRRDPPPPWEPANSPLALSSNTTSSQGSLTGKSQLPIHTQEMMYMVHISVHDYAWFFIYSYQMAQKSNNSSFHPARKRTPFQDITNTSSTGEIMIYLHLQPGAS